MSTQRKITSARANGSKSHGPKTAAGKEVSSLNALKHGLAARTVILPNEPSSDYDALLSGYIGDLHPAGPVQTDLVVEMVNARWRQNRACRIETEMYEDQMERQKERLAEDYNYYTVAVEQAHAFRTLSDTGRMLALSRSESRLERAYSRALKNLLQLQRLRQPEHASPEPSDSGIGFVLQPAIPPAEPSPAERN
jgi:hypothetical protein